MQKRLAYTRDSVLYKKPPHPYECIFRSNLPLIPIANQPPILIEIRQPFRCLCRFVVVTYTSTGALALIERLPARIWRLLNMGHSSSG